MNGNRNSGVGGGGGGGGGGCGGGGSGGSGALTPLECDVGLGLNTDPSYPCKKTSLINHRRPHDFGGVYGNNGGQLFVNPTTAANQIASGFSFKSTTGGVIGASGKVLFTATQWQELERQTMVYKYIMASIPIPPQLLLPSSTQSNRTNTGIRFSNGSDPEPWRCRRTDGKKWRCSKDVGPNNQKYCDRHAHKTRSRSRKPVDMNHTNNNHNPTTSSSNPQTRYNESNTQLKRDDCSLSLSMQSGGNVNANVNGFEFGDQDSFQMAVRLLEGDKVGCGDGFRLQNQWVNQGGWVGSNPGSTPGGPLGEALCLGISGTANVGLDVASPYGYSNSTSTSGSCEGGDGRGWFH